MARQADESADAATRGAAPMTVLVADDDDASRSGLASLVRSLGHRCLEASDGEEAWRIFEQQTVDVVLSDWRMPAIEGVELCRKIRGAPLDRYVYFVLVTAMGDRAHYMQAMNAGADDFLSKPIDVDELSVRLHVASRMVKAQRALRRTNERLRRDSSRAFATARIDPLTGIPNRRALDEELTRTAARIARHGQTCAFAMCDIDLFKSINDKYGHRVGDAVLRSVATTIASSLRAGDTVYRFGGEEFAILLPHETAIGARAALERVRRAIAGTRVPLPDDPEGTVSTTISVGVTDTNEGGPDQWLERADGALYTAKRLGRDRLIVAGEATS